MPVSFPGSRTRVSGVEYTDSLQQPLGLMASWRAGSGLVVTGDGSLALGHMGNTRHVAWVRPRQWRGKVWPKGSLPYPCSPPPGEGADSTLWTFCEEQDTA